ncbi:MAG TPA: SGNH/GDSL hydrolase family protein [Verrucomicrobiae bacterium]|jgi:lysophospholipase L1-like esterase|nr:SGNH/GDSL hydrolase family protein [Verrucomicrobiae bacterium]
MIVVMHGFCCVSKILILAAVVALSGFTAVGQTNVAKSRWEPEIKAFEAGDRTNFPARDGVLFVGSSSIRLWQSLPEDFAGWRVINRGFGGSEIADSTALADRIIFPYQPATIVFYAGDNDLAAGHSVAQVVADYQAFVQKVETRLPEVRIIYISIKPSPARWGLRDKMAEANAQIAAQHDDHVKFVDVFTPMLGSDGQPRREFYKPDGLHPTAACYRLWASLIKPQLEKSP